ncbi:MAG: adenine nucleotide alpha hydrolase family protein [Candidatus Limnocylindrales bacterium]
MAAAAALEIGTPETRSLCGEISDLSGGTVLLAFSGGKDSVAAWIALREHFTRVIPFHCASVPHLGFVDRALDYYERAFDTPILRYMHEECLGALHDLVFQPLADEQSILWLDIWEYDKLAIAEMVRSAQGVPDAWSAYGIALTDSIERRAKVADGAGRFDASMRFYPCWNWSRKQILSTIADKGIKLGEAYLLANRSFCGIPTARHIERMEALFPADFERVETMFPFVRAVIARNEFRRRRSSATAPTG